MRSTEATLETSFPPAGSLTTYIFTSTVYLISFNWCRKQFLDWKPLFPKKAKLFIASNISYITSWKHFKFHPNHWKAQSDIYSLRWWFIWRKPLSTTGSSTIFSCPMLFTLYWHCYMKSEEKCTGFLWKNETLSRELYNFICSNIPVNSRHNKMAKNWELQSWTKVLRHFSKTNVFELTTVLCFWMKASFSSIVTRPLLPQTMLQTASLMLFVSNIEKVGRGTRGYLSRGHEENLQLGKICW